MKKGILFIGLFLSMGMVYSQSENRALATQQYFHSIQHAVLIPQDHMHSDAAMQDRSGNGQNDCQTVVQEELLAGRYGDVHLKRDIRSFWIFFQDGIIHILRGKK